MVKKRTRTTPGVKKDPKLVEKVQEAVKQVTDNLSISGQPELFDAPTNKLEYAIKFPNRIRAEACRRSLFTFIKEFWHLISEETPVWNWHIEYLCLELQKVVKNVVGEPLIDPDTKKIIHRNRKPKEYDLIINIPPGTTKSTICTIMFPAWCWTNDPSLQFISCSYSSALSLQHSDKSREIIRSDKYKVYFPEIKIREDKDLKSDYGNTEKGERFTTSVGGSATGMHAHIIIVDDPLNPQQALSDADRSTANKWLDNTLSTRKIDKAVTPTIIIMQRVEREDCTGHILEKRGNKKLKHICLPADITDPEAYAIVNPPELRDRYINGLLDPVRLSRDVLDQMEDDLGPYNYSGQIQQNPTNREGRMFKTENFRILDRLTAFTDIVKSVRYWDKAGTEDGGKFTAGVLMHKMKNGSYVIADVVRGQWAAPKREIIIKSIAEHDGSGVDIWVEQEPGSGGKESAESTIKNLAGYIVRAEKVTGAKEVRAEPYALQVEAGNICIMDKPWKKMFIREHDAYPGKFRDQVDAASGAFNKLAGPRGRIGAWGSRK